MWRGLILLAVLSTSCASAVQATRTSDYVDADRTVRVTRDRFGGSVDVRVGDVLVVERPADYDEWSLAFSTEVLRSLNTEEGRRRPPADGWTFAVIAKGTTDLAITPYVPRGGTPNVPKFVVTVTAE